uniref:Motility protein n=1 Tax=uncultured bacterium contig00087 TaxID=1181560 RepID=A0A806KH29_9BACT|nr:hypothetical protein [uncultured bacterium contig00087]
MSQTRLQEQAAVQVQSMAIDTIQGQSALLEKLLDSAQVITDPNLGRNVNVIA